MDSRRSSRHHPDRRPPGRVVRDAEVLAVEDRPGTFDETVRLAAEIEAGFSVAFLFVGVERLLAGDPLLAGGLIVLGLLGASSLVVTVRTLPQVRRLRRPQSYATNRAGPEE